MLAKDHIRTRRAFIAILIYCAAFLVSCSYNKVLREPVPLEIKNKLAFASEGLVSASLDWVIVQNGPGTWVRNARWDEYIMSIANNYDTEISVLDVIVVDFLGTDIHRESDRRLLVEETKKTTQRYKKKGLKVEPGQGTTSLLATGLGIGAVATAGAYAGAATAATAASLSSLGGIGSAASAGGASVAAGAAAGAFCFALPVAAGYATTRHYSESKVRDAIKARQTSLPHILPSGSQRRFSLFFPLAPSPLEVRISYEQDSKMETLTLNVRESLSGLHIEQEEGDRP